ncbi:MAG: hypothetical protein HC819_10225 [Cyclobacteriaceae bacterium]|nr:hypothetical protein [Cyclobacteriaceae bacterium]
MIRKDYILRIVDEFGKFMAKIIGLRLEGKIEEALNEIDNVYDGLIEADPRVLKSIKTKALLPFLIDEKGFNNQYLRMIADLHFEEGMLYIENGDPVSARNVMEKARVLITYLMDNDSIVSFDWQEKLRMIEELLAD